MRTGLVAVVLVLISFAQMGCGKVAGKAIQKGVGKGVGTALQKGAVKAETASARQAVRKTARSSRDPAWEEFKDDAVDAAIDVAKEMLAAPPSQPVFAPPDLERDERKATYPVVTEVTPSGPAHKAGVQVGDILLSYNAVDLSGQNSTFDALRDAVSRSPHEPVVIVVDRRGQRLEGAVPGGQLIGINVAMVADDQNRVAKLRPVLPPMVANGINRPSAIVKESDQVVCEQGIGVPFTDENVDGLEIVGIEFTLARFGRKFQGTAIGAIRPVFHGQLGNWHGTQHGDKRKITARDGFRFAGMDVAWGGRIMGLNLHFSDEKGMSYSSGWVGQKTDHVTKLEVAPGSCVGIFGSSRKEVSGEWPTTIRSLGLLARE